MKTSRTVVALVACAILATPPARPCCQLGGTACGDPFAVDCNDGAVCFFPFRTCNGCTCTLTNGGQTCLANSEQPGRVPALRATKDLVTPGRLVLDWDPSCSAAATDYSIQEGSLGAWYSHDAALCSTSGALSASIAPGPGDRYFLVAPISGDWTGSSGTDSADAERPDSIEPCTADRAIASCP